MNILKTELSHLPRPGNPTRYPVLMLTLLVSLASCKPPSTALPVSATVPVTVSAIEVRHIKDVIILDGTIAPSQQVNLIARVPGNLDAIHFRDGQWVKKGELLFSIERRPYLDQLTLNQARLNQTRSDYQRQKELLKENANSETNVELALSNLQQAKANCNIAKTNLSYTEVRAPFDGILGKHQVDAGNYVGAAGSPTVLGTIIQIAPVYVNAAVGENEAIRIRRHQATLKRDIGQSVGKTAVYAQLQGETGFSEAGVLDFIDHQLNQTSGTVAVRGVFANSGHHLLPGFYARLSIEASQGRDALVVPRALVQTDAQGDYVYVVGRDNVARRRAVSTELLPKENVEITKGLVAGENVVSNGYARLSDSVPVQILNQPAARSGALP